MAIWPPCRDFAPLVITTLCCPPYLSCSLTLTSHGRSKAAEILWSTVFSSKMAGRSKPTERKPHFFKILLGDFKQRLKIPPKFMKHIPKEASRRVILQGPSGGRWKVRLSKTRTGNFLSTGWSNFVKDQSLKEKEFLLFRYDGNMYFHVMIFDTTACEKEDAFEMNPRKSNYEGKRQRGRPRKCPLNGNCILQHQSNKNKLKLLSDNRHTSRQLHGNHASPNSCINATVSTEDVDLPPNELPSKTFSSTRRRPVTTEERSKAEKSANSFRSHSPYTIIRMTKYQVYEKFTVKFRLGFSRIHLPRVRTTLILRDPSGKAWPVSYIPGHRDFLSKGWPAFAHSNKIEEGDFCAFELIGKLEFKVHIFRVVEETAPSGQITVKSP